MTMPSNPPIAAPKPLAQPRSLYSLIAVKSLDSFGFLGLRALLIIYLVEERKFSDAQAFDLLGAFLSLSFLTPLVGGLISDRLAGQRATAMLGVFLTTAGYLTLAAEEWSSGGQAALLITIALACISCGNGFVKSCVMTMVGGLYAEKDPRRDAGFSLGYMGMNIGGLLSAVSCAAVAIKLGWAAAFLLLALVNVSGLIILGISRNDAAARQYGTSSGAAHAGLLSAALATVAGAACLMNANASLSWLLIAAALVTLGYIVQHSLRLGSLEERNKTAAALILSFFAVLAWVFIEQSAGSLNLLAQRHLPKLFLGIPIAAPQYQSLTPLFLIVLAPFMGALWTARGSRGHASDAAVKFAIGLGFFFASFATLGWAARHASSGALISPWWLIAGYALASVGELLISPIGLSMVTRLAMPGLRGTMMGAWFLAFAGGEFLAQKVGKLTTLGSQSSAASLDAYANSFLWLGSTALLFACILVVLRHALKRLQLGEQPCRHTP